MLWEQRLGRLRLPVDHPHHHPALLLLRWRKQLGRQRLRLWLREWLRLREQLRLQRRLRLLLRVYLTPDCGMGPGAHAAKWQKPTGLHRAAVTEGL